MMNISLKNYISISLKDNWKESDLLQKIYSLELKNCSVVD